MEGLGMRSPNNLFCPRITRIHANGGAAALKFVSIRVIRGQKSLIRILVPKLRLGTTLGAETLFRALASWLMRETEFPEQVRSQTEFGHEVMEVWERGAQPLRGT